MNQQIGRHMLGDQRDADAFVERRARDLVVDAPLAVVMAHNVRDNGDSQSVPPWKMDVRNDALARFSFS